MGIIACITEPKVVDTILRGCTLDPVRKEIPMSALPVSYGPYSVSPNPLTRTFASWPRVTMLVGQ